MKNKKMLYMIGIISGIMILLIVIIAVISSVTGKALSFNKIEDKMKNAAIKYYQAREEELPVTNGSTITVSASQLVESKNLKAIDKMTPKGVNCTGQVIVTKNGDNYLYSPILNCGEDYQSKKLYEVVTSKNNIVISGDGLYAKENGYVFKGENVDNLVKIGDNYWAIIDVDNQGYMRLVYVRNNRKRSSNWDDRYNINENSYVGINDYSVSRLKETLKDLEEDDDLLPIEYREYVAIKSWCIGKRSENNKAINTTEECSAMSEEQLFGLPYVGDMFAASIDANCKTIDDNSCDNYNYLSGYGISSWTLTGVSNSTSSAYYVFGAGYAPTKTSTNKNITPVIYLSKNVMFVSGNGTVEEPYVLK